jgi:hypothetical protein
MLSIGYTSQYLSFLKYLKARKLAAKNLNVLLKMPRKVRHLLNSQISCY